MSLIATNPLARWTYDPWRAMLQKRHPSRCFGTNPLLSHAQASNCDQLTDRRVDEPRRVVVAVPPAGSVDQNPIDRPDLAGPARDAQVVRERPEARTARFLDRRRDPVVGCRGSSGSPRIRADV